MNQDDIVDSLVEVTLPKEDHFLIVKETLTRMGVASYRDRTLYQSCHILHKRGRYYIVHFKELFLLDGKSSNFSEEDIARRNTIVKAISDWGLVTIVNPHKVQSPIIPISQVKIISSRQKSEWKLVPKYTIGRK